MIYKVDFTSKSKKDWDNSIKIKFKEILSERRKNPFIKKHKLHGTGKRECYKIKLQSVGYRLIYEVLKSEETLVVLVIDKRENNTVYEVMQERLK